MQISVGVDGLQIIFMGALLFALGLFQGLLIPAFKNPRMALSAHLTAVQAGTAIIAFGVTWSFINLPRQLLLITKVSFVGGNYLIWFGIILAAYTGASKALPIAGKGFVGTQRAELSVNVLAVTGIALSLLSGVLIVAGLGSTAFGA